LCDNHPGILAGKREKLAFATTAIFSRFPNKNPENATLVKIFSNDLPRFIILCRNPKGNLCKTALTKIVASDLWPDTQGFPANLSGHSPDSTSFAEISNGIAI